MFAFFCGNNGGLGCPNGTGQNGIHSCRQYCLVWNTCLHAMDDCVPRCGISQQHVVWKITRKPLLLFRTGDAGNAARSFKLVVCSDAAEAPLMKKNAAIQISLG